MRPKSVVVLVGALLASLVPSVVGVAPAGAATRSLGASADTYADSSTPSTALGRATRLGADASPSRVIYLRFDVGALDSAVTKATLSLHVQANAAGPSRSTGRVQRVASTTWSETATTWSNRPAVGAVVAPARGAAAAGAWINFDVTTAVRSGGTLSFAVVQDDPDGVFYDSREGPAAYRPLLAVSTAAVTEQHVLAAGDIAGCTWDGDELTAEILDAHPNGVVAALGDTVQVAGTAAEFRDCYAPTWGRHKARTRPTIGNHEYLTDLGKAYWDYFGSAAGPAYKGWYSYDLGPSWHVVVLNSDCWRTGGCEKGKPQEAWLRADLAANARPCTLVYFHKPLFSSIEGEPGMRAIWDTLYEFNADLVLNGHKHGYERFAPQRPDGTRDSARGIREIVVATGGSPEFYPYGAILPTSEVHATQVHGVLDLTLTATGYRFNFLPAADTTFTDSGSGTCH